MPAVKRAVPRKLISLPLIVNGSDTEAEAEPRADTIRTVPVSSEPAKRPTRTIDPRPNGAPVIVP